MDRRRHVVMVAFSLLLICLSTTEHHQSCLSCCCAACRQGNGDVRQIIIASIKRLIINKRGQTGLWIISGMQNCHVHIKQSWCHLRDRLKTENCWVSSCDNYEHATQGQAFIIEMPHFTTLRGQKVGFQLNLTSESFDSLSRSYLVQCATGTGD